MVCVILFVEAELVPLVVVLLEVEQDRGGFKDDKVVPRAVDEHGDAAVWVQLDEPRLLLDVCADVNPVDAAGGPGLGQLLARA